MSNSKKSSEDTSKSGKKPYDEILEEEIEVGSAEVNRSAWGLLFSSLSAGIDIGFSLLFMAVALALMPEGTPPLVEKAIVANMYAIGFIFVKLGRSELFTEHTTLAIFPLLSGRARMHEVLRVWGLVYLGNLVGGMLFAAITVFLGPRLGVIGLPVFGEIAKSVMSASGFDMLLSAIMAGWLMGLLSWLSAATTETIGQVVCVWLVTTGIGFVGLHHSILGSVEVLGGVMTNFVSISEYLSFLFFVSVGNAFGGTIFAKLKHAHATRGEQ